MELTCDGCPFKGDNAELRKQRDDALECRDKMARELLDHKKVIEELQKGLAELRRM